MRVSEVSRCDPEQVLRQAQAARVAKGRGVTVLAVQALVRANTEGRALGLLGEPRVNVLRLNLALDEQFPVK